jgi:hypothetical protein
MARSIKTFAHALTLSTGNRVLSVKGKPDYTLTLKVSKDGDKTFTLACGSDAPVTVKASEHGASGSGVGNAALRDIAEQLCERLASRSGAGAAEMALGEGAARVRVALNLEPVSVKRAK